ncbi:MAG: hypothetical protein JOZ18_20215 [Chloroflexi bacterium]|nr:hypothetical protein [Chloroflexota bacterium]
MKRQDQPVDEILKRMRRHQDALNALREILITRVKLQYYTETQFKDLVVLAREGIALLDRYKAGDVIGPEWIEERDSLVERAQRLIQDAEEDS